MHSTSTLAAARAKGTAMAQGIWAHVSRHRWFYLALGCGALAWAATPALSFHARLAVTGDAFYLIYLVLVVFVVVRAPASAFRDWVEEEDEGLFLVMLITVAAVVFSLVSIFSLLNAGHGQRSIFLLLSLASAPLGWLVLHTVTALHYARAYYRGEEGPDPKGLSFPGTQEPGVWEFLYYSFVVGMTAQVSDVQVLSTPMRRLTLLHGLISFAFNTFILALAVNVIASAALT
jgi:uncharacterized membrane protein